MGIPHDAEMPIIVPGMTCVRRPEEPLGNCIPNAIGGSREIAFKPDPELPFAGLIAWKDLLAIMPSFI